MANTDEILYSARINKHGSLELTKWDGHKRPAESYRILYNGEGACDCMGYGRNLHCKHIDIIKKWRALGPFEGAFYDYDTGTLYTPLDGEGIPLEGAFDILQAYQTQPESRDCSPQAAQHQQE